MKTFKYIFVALLFLASSASAFDRNIVFAASNCPADSTTVCPASRIVSYKLYQSTNGGQMTLVGTVPTPAGNTVTVPVTGLAFDTTYVWVAEVTDTFGTTLRGALSDPFSVPSLGAPGRPFVTP